MTPPPAGGGVGGSGGGDGSGGLGGSGGNGGSGGSPMTEAVTSSTAMWVIRIVKRRRTRCILGSALWVY